MKRLMNFANGVEVRCPRQDTDVDVLDADGCLPGCGERCQHLDRIAVGSVVCDWPEAGGRK